MDPDTTDLEKQYISIARNQLIYVFGEFTSKRSRSCLNNLKPRQSEICVEIGLSAPTSDSYICKE